MPSFATSVSIAEIAPKNVSRKSLIFLNEDGTDSIYIKRERSESSTVSSTDHDYKILPNSVIALNSGVDGTQAIQGRWTCVASANTPRISWFETEDIIR